MRLSMIQTNPGPFREKNLEEVTRLANEAVANGSELIVLPEFFSSMGSESERRASAESLESGTFRFLADLARGLGVYIIGGSSGEKADGDKLFNTHQSYSPDGCVINTYRKLHLFHLSSAQGEKEFRESDWCLRGQPPQSLFRIRSSGLDWKALTVICYDLRFPEIFRRPYWSDDPPDVIFIPSAFTHRTGRAHWKTLIQARAIENQCFVVACNQTGTFGSGHRNYGHSMVVGPWGEVIAEMGEEVGLSSCDIDYSALSAVRAQIPALSNRMIKS